MEERGNHRGHWYVAALALLAAGALLAWEHTHGGVPSHHLLDRPDLPAVSNGWSIVVLPLLGWLASRSAFSRVRAQAASGLGVALAFAGSASLGVALSVAFTTGHASLSSWLFLAAFACGIPLRTYRPEYLFGFVVGMAFAFGAVLPTLVGSVAALTSLVFHRLVRPAVGWAFAHARA